MVAEAIPVVISRVRTVRARQTSALLAARVEYMTVRT
jgi:hypothetical protein